MQATDMQSVLDLQRPMHLKALFPTDKFKEDLVQLTMLNNMNGSWVS